MPGLTSNTKDQDSPEYQALSSYLKDAHQQDQALDAFCEPIEDHFTKAQPPEDVEPLLWRAWRSITTVAAGTPHDSDQRQRLADLVTNLQYRPTLESEGKTCSVWDAVVWKDLPIFGAQMREAWNSGKYPRSPASRTSRCRC